MDQSCFVERISRSRMNIFYAFGLQCPSVKGVKSCVEETISTGSKTSWKIAFVRSTLQSGSRDRETRTKLASTWLMLN